MISRFYYCLTAPVSRLHHINENEFGMVLQKDIPMPEPLPPQQVFDRYAPINQNLGLYWLIEELTGIEMAEDTDVTTQLLAHIWFNLYDKNVGYVDVQHPDWEQPSKPYTGTDYIEMKHELGNSILSLYIDTKDYYETLIGIYEDELEHLMSPVENKTIVSGTNTASNSGNTRFNDTPQNVPVDDGYAEDNYTTNVTKINNSATNTISNTSTNTNDLTSKMNRIDEVQRLLKNLYADWAFEFNKLIVGE